MNTGLSVPVASRSMSRISSISSVNGSSFDGRAEAVVVRGCGPAEVRTLLTVLQVTPYLPARRSTATSPGICRASSGRPCPGSSARTESVGRIGPLARSAAYGSDAAAMSQGSGVLHRIARLRAVNTVCTQSVLLLDSLHRQEGLTPVSAVDSQV